MAQIEQPTNKNTKEAILYLGARLEATEPSNAATLYRVAARLYSDEGDFVTAMNLSSMAVCACRSAMSSAPDIEDVRMILKINLAAALREAGETERSREMLQEGANDLVNLVRRLSPSDSSLGRWAEAALCDPDVLDAESGRAETNPLSAYRSNEIEKKVKFDEFQLYCDAGTILHSKGFREAGDDMFERAKEFVTIPASE